MAFNPKFKFKKKKQKISKEEARLFHNALRSKLKKQVKDENNKTII